MEIVTPKLLSSLAIRSVTGSVGAARAARQSARILKAVTELQNSDSDASRYVLSAVADLQSTELPENEMVRLAKFLHSPEADVFVRSVAIAVMTREFETSRRALTDELTALLVMAGQLGTRTAGTASNKLITITATTIQKITTGFQVLAPAEYGALIDRAMHEKNSGYLRYLAHRTEIFRDRAPHEYYAILEFCTKYREQVRRSSNELIPAYFDIQRRAPIESIYIDPRVSMEIALPNSTVSELGFRGLVEEVYRPVVLGDPGAGKSTLAQRIAYYYASDEAKSHSKYVEIVPIVIPLRRYESYCHDRAASIPEFMYDYIAERYHLRAPSGCIEYLLASGRAVVVFDGIDELLNIGRRQQICAAIETFASLYANIPIVTTSRRIGYLEAPLRPSVFTTCDLQPFTDTDIQSYVTAWFKLDSRITPPECSRITESFLEESLSVPDIRSNALMLGLLCNVYKGSREIPQNRAELYEKCALMLFEQWDSGRGISRSGVMKADARAALQDVAFWIYTTPPLSDGVPEKVLLARLQAYWARRFEDPEDALSSAKAILRAWKGRSWILTDVGSSPDSRQSLYRFTHQTFLEYFASVELTKRNSSPLALWEVLGPRLRLGTWDVIAQLSIQRLNEFVADAGDAITKLLIASARSSSLGGRLNLLNFAMRNLDALYATTQTVRELATEAADLCLLALPSISVFPTEWTEYSRGLSDELRGQYSEEVDSSDPSLEDLADAHSLADPLREIASEHGEPGKVARDAVSRHLESKMLDATDPSSGAKAFVVAASVHWLVPGDEVGRGSLHEGLMSAISRVATPRRIEMWAAEIFWVPIVACRLGLIGIDEVVELSGWHSVLCGVGAFEENATTFAEEILQSYLGVVGESSAGSRRVYKNALARIGHELLQDEGALDFDSNWLGITPDLCKRIVSPRFGEDNEVFNNQKVAESNRETAFAAAILVAIFFEIEGPQLRDYSDDQIADLRLGPIQALEPIYIERALPSEGAEILSGIGAFNLGDEASSILHSWALKRFSIVLTSDH